MKSISYGCLIYIFLTINYGSPSHLPPEKYSADTSTKCSSTTVVIKESKYLTDCKSLTFNNTDLSDELTFPNGNLYLCSGINETLKRICKLQKNLAITKEEFDTKMKNFDQPTHQLKNLPTTKSDTFCPTMHNILTSLSYIKAINSSTTPMLTVLNKNLESSTCHMICWDPISKSSSPLCNVLLWANQLLVNITTNNIDHSTDPKNPDTPDESLNTNHILNGNVESSDNGMPSQQNSDDIDIREPVVLKQEGTKPNHVDEPAVPGDNPAAGKADENPPQLSVVPASRSNNQSEAEVAQHFESRGDSENRGESASLSKDAKVASHSSGVQPRRDNINSVPEETVNQNAQHTVGNDREPQVSGDPNVSSDTGAEIENGDNSQIGNVEVETPPLKSIASEDTADSPLSQEDIPDGQNEAVKRKNVVPQENVSAHPGPPDPPQHFFAYFMAVSFICLVCYIGYHKKHKIMAIIFEGRKSRGGRGRRRPNTAGYRKLDCNLEEAVTSQCNSNVTHVIY